MPNHGFNLECPYNPKGDQPQAIEQLTDGLMKSGKKHQTLLGVTGSGKTFTLANVIQAYNRPTLVLAPNKTLAAQLFGEFHIMFPDNAVEFFISYFDYYQPEAYLPNTDTYIEKDSAINEHIDKLRHQATKSVLSREDVIVVASVSSIYGIGSPEIYGKMRLPLSENQSISIKTVAQQLTHMQFQRVINDELERGTFRMIGSRLDIYPAYDDLEALRIQFVGDRITEISRMDPVSGFRYSKEASVEIFPASHYVLEADRQQSAIKSIQAELKERLAELRHLGKVIEANRLEQRANQDLEMLLHLGFCRGIENYSRHLEDREPGEPPFTLIDYFPKDFLLIIDESHITVPQVRGMYAGDRSRKQTLVEYGFRLPSALDNRPLNYPEFESHIHRVIYVSATPGPYELQQSLGAIVQQIIRPTGLLDPEVHIYPVNTQVDHLLGQIKPITDRNQRILVLTLTKKMAENFSEFLRDAQIPSAYLHADVKTLDRTRILEQFRRGDFHVLVGINLLREGIDLPEVELVVIFDADKEGFLRSKTSLIQMMGRAARNVNGKVFVYANKMTPAINDAVKETQRRQKLQKAFNEAHHITPQTVFKPVTNVLEERLLAISSGEEEFHHHESDETAFVVPKITEEELKDKNKLIKKIKSLRKQMQQAAQKLEFEKAQALKQSILDAEKNLMFEE